MVDLSKARAGDRVKFRCGGTAVIDTVKGTSTHDHEGSDGFIITFKGDTKVHSYWWNAQVDFREQGILDITEVIPAPVAFDWSTAKWGDAFKATVADIERTFIFVGINPLDGEEGVFINVDKESSTIGALNEFFTRAPEHDVEVG